MRLLTVREVAGMLNVSPKTIYFWCAIGLVPHLKINGTIRFDPAEIEMWIRKFKKGPDGEYN